VCSVTITETKENIFYTAENKYCGLKCVSFELEKLYNFNVMHINLASKRMSSLGIYEPLCSLGG
jgi:hypothetical protein